MFPNILILEQICCCKRTHILNKGAPKLNDFIKNFAMVMNAIMLTVFTQGSVLMKILFMEFQLIAGLYTFRVQVTGKNQFGEASVNVTVKPRKLLLCNYTVVPSYSEH